TTSSRGSTTRANSGGGSWVGPASAIARRGGGGGLSSRADAASVRALAPASARAPPAHPPWPPASNSATTSHPAVAPDRRQAARATSCSRDHVACSNEPESLVR